MLVEVSNDTEQREGILIISATAPAISTYETDRAKHQLMQQYTQGGPAHSLTWTQQQPSDCSNDDDQTRDTDGRWCFCTGH